MVVLRSPVAGDIERLVPGADVVRARGADFEWCALVDPSELAAAIVRSVQTVEAERAELSADTLRRACVNRATCAVCDVYGGRGRLGFRGTDAASPRDAFLFGSVTPRSAKV